MSKILYASCTGLFVVILAQFALKMCFSTQNRQKFIKTLILLINFGANRKPVYDFLLVINSNLGLSRTVSEIWRLIG